MKEELGLLTGCLGGRGEWGEAPLPRGHLMGPRGLTWPLAGVSGRVPSKTGSQCQRWLLPTVDGSSTKAELPKLTRGPCSDI